MDHTTCISRIILHLDYRHYTYKSLFAEITTLLESHPTIYFLWVPNMELTHFKFKWRSYKKMFDFSQWER